MAFITLEQALFHRLDREAPHLVAHSPGFDPSWIAAAEALIHGFGERRQGMRCPLAIFAKPLTKTHVAVVRVTDDRPGPMPLGMRFHFLVVPRKDYEMYIRDPFMLAEKFEPVWDAQGTLPAPTMAISAFRPRTLAQVQAVLKRVKASALREGEDPESPDFERTIENSESPALLGGTQILVDGGRLIFERPMGDLPLVAGLWLLLPEMTRTRLWPTSFAFGPHLDFDVLVVPFLDDHLVEGYTTEDQASAYPDGAYELALQHAAESGTQNDLDAVFSRRDGHRTVRLALMLLVVVSAVVLFSRWLNPVPSNPLPVREQMVATAAGIVAVGEPWTALGMMTAAKMLWKGDQ